MRVRELQTDLSPGSLPESAAAECQREMDALMRRAAVLRKKLVPRPSGGSAPSFAHLYGELQVIDSCALFQFQIRYIYISAAGVQAPTRKPQPEPPNPTP
jgi:hypothetical protein